MALSAKCGLVVGLFASALPGQVNVLTANYGNERTNANPQERILAPANVSPENFGKIGSFPVDGAIYAQPLYARNVVYVATMGNTVYAIDADAPESRSPLWSVNLGPSVPTTFFGLALSEIGSEIGILSTPAIDLARNAIYVVTDTFEKSTTVFRLHALDLSDGSEKFGGPVEIKADAFEPAQHLQRPGLLLANDTVYIAFGSHSDEYPYHGWVMGYDASDIHSQVAVFNTTPNGDQGSIWQSGRGLAADASGNLYVATGNGDYDGVWNFSQSFLKLSPGLRILDWFTPRNWRDLSDGDYDLGSLGPVLIPGTDQFIGGDKAGNMYLVDRQDMGRLGTEEGESPQIFQPVVYSGIFNTALWQSTRGTIVYVVEAGEMTRAFRMAGGRFETAPFSVTGITADLVSQGMAVSSDGDDPGTGILWMTTGNHGTRGAVPGTLHALDALDLTNELWSSEMNGDRDRLGEFTKYVAPTVVNGRVYVPTSSNELAMYGLLTAAPVGGVE